MKRQLIAALLWAGLAGPLGEAHAQHRRFEVPSQDWTPTAAWRVRAQQVREHRWQLIQHGDFARLNGGQVFRGPGALRTAAGAATAVVGQLNVPVVPIAYADMPMPFPPADYQAVLFADLPPNGRPHTLRSYYREASNGLLLLSGQIMEPVKTVNNATYYEQNCNGWRSCPDNGKRMGDMLILTLDSISSRPGNAAIWSQFDNDGPDGLPNSGDDDGEVDFVAFLQPRVDGACNSIPSPGIWAHRGRLASYNSNSKYQTQTPRRNAAGQPIPGQFLTIDSYIIQSAVGGADACTPAQIMAPGIIIHETGHAFGLPDLYDTRSTGEGLGEWAIMASGGYSSPLSPSAHDAWSLNELGWVAVDTLSGTRTVTTGPRSTSDTVFLARLEHPRQYLLIENRQPVGSDTALLNPSLPITNCYGGCRKAPGLLIYHIDLDRIAAGRPTNRVNVGTNSGVALIQADGRRNLEFGGLNRGDAGDSYPGSTGNTRWSFASTPRAKTNQNQYAGFVIDRITELPNMAMRFRMVRRLPSLFHATVSGTKLSVDGVETTRLEEVFAAGDTVALTADSLQPINAASRYRFTGWSKGGPRTQRFLSGATPDTVTPGFATELRLLVTTKGSGAVSADKPGSPKDGLFVTSGTPVILKASSPPGVAFAGWAGDTTATDSTLTVPMAKPYSIEANFAGEIIAVALEAATTDLLGTPTLTADQKVALDFQGNRNSRYDLGDYLAMLKRAGLAMPPAVLEAIATGTIEPTTNPGAPRKGN